MTEKKEVGTSTELGGFKVSCDQGGPDRERRKMNEEPEILAVYKELSDKHVFAFAFLCEVSSYTNVFASVLRSPTVFRGHPGDR